MTHFPSQDQDLRTALHKAVSKALHNNQFADGWPEMVDPVVDAVLALSAPPRPEHTVGVSPTQAPDKAGEREGVAGWKLMPPKPTDEMVRAARSQGIGVHSFTLAYEAAVALAPKPTGTEAGRGVIPDGWKLAPEVETDEMLKIGMKAADQKWIAWTGGRSPLDGMMFFVREAYRAMLAATPTPPVSPDSPPAGAVTDDAGFEHTAQTSLNWRGSAMQFSRNADFYRGIVVQIGEMFGDAAKTSDDGSVQQDVLALRVPELVAALHPSAPTASEAAAPAGDAQTQEGGR